MNRKTTISILFFALALPVATLAQSAKQAEFQAVRYPTSTNPSTTTAASFAWGMSLDGGATYVTSAKVSDPVKVSAKVRVESASIGSKGDLFVVDLVNGQWTMENSSGAFVPWDFVVDHLVPFISQVTLTAETPLTAFDGKISASGSHMFFLGYRANGGNLIYTPVSQNLTIAALSATDQAYDKFVTTISPNIIGSRCIVCHVSGGLADGKALHIFKEPLANNLSTNFKTFQNLVSNRGVNYILTKVTGGNSHGGGVQLTASSQDYKDLQSFLTLVAQDVPDLSASTTQSSTGTSTTYNDPYANDPYGYGSSY